MSHEMIQLVKASTIPPTERLVAFVLADYCNAKSGRCWPSVTTLALETGLTRRTVMPAIARLVQNGHLTIERRGVHQQCTSIYRLHPLPRPTGEGASPVETGEGSSLVQMTAPTGEGASPALVQMTAPTGEGASPRTGKNRNRTGKEPEVAAAAAVAEKSKSRKVEGDKDFAEASAYEFDMTAPGAIKAAWLEWQHYRQSRHTAKGERRLQWTLQAARLSGNAILSAAERHGVQIVQDRVAAAIAGEWKGLNLDKLDASVHRPGSRHTATAEQHTARLPGHEF